LNWIYPLKRVCFKCQVYVFLFFLNYINFQSINVWFKILIQMYVYFYMYVIVKSINIYDFCFKVVKKIVAKFFPLDVICSFLKVRFNYAQELETLQASVQSYNALRTNSHVRYLKILFLLPSEQTILLLLSGISTFVYWLNNICIFLCV
jgi:hypothetical protein